MPGPEPATEAAPPPLDGAIAPAVSAVAARRGVATSAAPIVFDLSRLLSRAGREAPTGIDRVEMAYARHLIAYHAPLAFAAVDAVGRIRLLARKTAADYVAALDAAWRGDNGAVAGDHRRIKQLALRLRGGTLLRDAPWPGRQADALVYLLVSHYRLEAQAAIARLKRRQGARFVCLIHDLIPIEFPEYAKPGQDRRHRRRIETAAALADGVITGTSAVREAFAPYLERAGRTPPVAVAPFGAQLPAAAPPERAEETYFVCVGTIEARKNHLLLLNLWRWLATELGPAAPRLALIGQRGWLTPHVIDMLERCPALRGLVVEHSTLSDAAMARLVRGARALLLPSFAEGFGFPVVEALALGVPVLCSDLAALRETGGGVPEHLDPLDGSGWRDAIVDYARPASPRRAAQLRRLAAWRPPRWEDHFAAVHELIGSLAAASRNGNGRAS